MKRYMTTPMRSLLLLSWLVAIVKGGAVMSETEMETATKALLNDENKKKVHKLLGHHVVETPEEHRKYELDLTLKTGKFQIETPGSTVDQSSPFTHHDIFKEESDTSSTAKKAKKSTNKLMKDYLDADTDGEMFTGQGTGQSDDPTAPPMVQIKDTAPTSIPSPVVAPPVVSPPVVEVVASKTSLPSSTSTPTTESKGKGKKDKKGKSKDADSSDDEDESVEASEKLFSPSRGPKGDKKDSSPAAAPSMDPTNFAISFAPTPTIRTNSSNTIVKRTLSASAFEYVLTTDATPTEEDLDELLNITDTFFKGMFTTFFETRPEAGFQVVEVSQLIAHRRNFVEFIVDLYFADTGAVPELAQLEEVARQQLGSAAEYRDMYLQMLRSSSIYGTTTLLLYVSDREELTALIDLIEPSVATNTTINATDPVLPDVRDAEVGDDADGSNSSNVTRIISPLAAFSGVLVLVGVLAHMRRNRHGRGMDRNENLMKHTRDDECFAEVGTVSSNTYHSNAYSDDDGTVSVAHAYESEYKRVKGANGHGVPRSPRVEMDDVSLGDDARSTNSVASATPSRSNSNDSDEGSVGTMLKAVRETMTADAFKPKRYAAGNQHVKPAWASRGYSSVATQSNAIDAPVESFKVVEPEEDVSEDEEGNTFELTEEASVFHGHIVSEYAKQELSLPELLETDERSAVAIVPKPEPVEVADDLEMAARDSATPTLSNQEIGRRTDEEILFAMTSKIAAADLDTNVKSNDTRPAWMKTQLKQVDASSPKWTPASALQATTPQSDEPEWMQKFKQMGLDKSS